MTNDEIGLAIWDREMDLLGPRAWDDVDDDAEPPAHAIEAVYTYERSGVENLTPADRV